MGKLAALHDLQLFLAIKSAMGDMQAHMVNFVRHATETMKAIRSIVSTSWQTWNKLANTQSTRHLL